MELTIRNEIQNDYRIVEEITRNAFWNIHVPGCNEHYLVHVLRKHKDFIPELDYVLLGDNKIIGNIMYAKSQLTDENSNKKNIITFGPVSILPEYQRLGYGTKLIKHSFIKAQEFGYEMIVIFGNPSNYVNLGFKSCKRYNICIGDNIFPSAMLAKELNGHISSEKKWTYAESEAYNIDLKKAEIYDFGFEPKEKIEKASQEEFYILSNSRII